MHSLRNTWNKSFYEQFFTFVISNDDAFMFFNLRTFFYSWSFSVFSVTIGCGACAGLTIRGYGGGLELRESNMNDKYINTIRYQIFWFRMYITFNSWQNGFHATMSGYKSIHGYSWGQPSFCSDEEPKFLRRSYLQLSAVQCSAVQCSAVLCIISMLAHGVDILFFYVMQRLL
jgi:hypothetical protein